MNLVAELNAWLEFHAYTEGGNTDNVIPNVSSSGQDVRHGCYLNYALQKQRNSCRCLTLIMACIIYWQAKEINRVLYEGDPESAGIDVSLFDI